MICAFCASVMPSFFAMPASALVAGAAVMLAGAHVGLEVRLDAVDELASLGGGQDVVELLHGVEVDVARRDGRGLARAHGRREGRVVDCRLSTC